MLSRHGFFVVIFCLVWPPLPLRAEQTVHLKLNWAYTDADAEQTHIATHLSDNRITTEDGSAAVRLILTQSPAGQNVLLMLESGYWNCGQECTLDMRFDDGQPISFAARPQPGTTSVSLEAPSGFIERLSHAAKLSIKAPIRGSGAQDITFDVSRLKWPRDNK